MSTYLKRTSALIAAALLALAIGFGLASAQQAYAAEGGENLQAGVVTQAAADLPYDGKVIGFFKENLEEQMGMLSPQDKVKYGFADGKLTITFTPSNSTIYHYFYLGGDITDVSTWQDDKFVELSYDANGVLTFTVDESYCGKATPVAVVKKAEKALKVIIDGEEKSNVTSAQYFLAIPSKEQLLNPGIEGTAHVTIANNGEIATSDGVETGVLMSHVPVDLAEVSKVKLADYGMGDLERDVDGDGANDITMVHLFVYMHEKYFADKAGGFSASMATYDWGTSLSITKFWGIAGTAVTYWLDDAMPMNTAESLALADGSDVDVYTYEYGSYYSDPNNYYFHFVDGASIQGEATAYAGVPAEFTLHQHGGGFDESFNLLVTPAADRSVSYGKVYGTAEGTATTDAEGKVSIEFPEAGTYYVWTDGLLGTVEGCEGKIVSAPACVTVDVKPTAINPTELSQGLYKVNGYKVDSSRVYYDAEDGPAYIYVDKNNNATLVARLYNAKYTHVWKGEAEGRPEASATDQMIATIPLLAGSYIENGTQKDHVWTDADGSAYGVAGAVYKAVSFAIPVTAEDLASGQVPICILNADGTWMSSTRHLQFESCTAVEGVDVSTWTPDFADVKEAVQLINAIPENPGADDMDAFAKASEAYIALDYSSTQDYGRGYIDALLPEVTAQLEAADASIPNVVPEDGTYFFTQTLVSYNYPSVAEAFVSDSVWSGALTVQDGKMTLQISQRRGSYSYLYAGLPSEAGAAEAAYQESTGVTTIGKNAAAVGNDKLLDEMPGASFFWNETEVYLDNPQTGANPVDSSITFAGPGAYPMYTGTFELKSLEKPVALSWRGSRWFNRSFVFHASNLFTTNEAGFIRAVDLLLNDPEEDSYRVSADAITLDDVDKVAAAEEAYSALSDDEKALVDALQLLSMNTPEDATDTQTYAEACAAAVAGRDQVVADKAVADEVEAEIAAALASGETADVAKARMAYDALTDDQKALVAAEALESLQQAEAQIPPEEYEAAIKAIQDQAAADAAIAQIEAAKSGEDAAAVAAARAAYDALTDDQKALVPADTLKALTDAEKVVADKAAADAAIALIEAAKSGTDEAAVAAARAAYDALTADQKALVPADTLKALTDAEKAIADKKAQEQKTTPSAPKVVKGKTYAVGGQSYTVTKVASGSAAGTVTFAKAKNAKKVTVPASVKLADGKTYDVTKIAKGAFKGTKAKTLVVKTTKLKKAGVKGSLKGSKVKTVKVPKAKKKAYKKIFTKKVVGKKVKVK